MKPPAILLALLGAVALRAESPSGAAPAGPVVSLPPMLVEGLSAHAPRWRYAAIPGFEILSCADDEATEKFALKLYRLHAQLRALVPAALLVRQDEPMTLIFYPQSRAESLSEEMMAELKRAQNARDNPSRVRAPPNLDLRDSDSSMLFSVIDDGDSGHGWRNLGSVLGVMDYGDLVLSPEHVASLIRDRAPSPPPWFVAGFGRFYATLETSETAMEFSPDPWLGPDQARVVKNRPDAFRPTLPMVDLLTGRYPPDRADPASHAYHLLWLAESELFIRWCLDGKAVPTGSARDALWHFADEASRQPVTETLFRRSFGFGFSDMRDELSDYLASAVARPVTIAIPDSGAEPACRLSDATPATILRIKGEWSRRTLQLIRAQHPALLPIYIQQARQTLQKAYDEHERDARLIADLGLLYCGLGERDSARRYLEEAFAAGRPRASALAQLARLRLDEAKRHPGAANGKLTPSQVESVLEPVRAARGISPPQLLAYSVAAELATRSPGGPTAELRALMTEGAELFPSIAPLVAAAAIRLREVGDTVKANELLDLGLWTATEASAYANLKAARNQPVPKPAP
jgi:hypothetical protein